MESSWRDGQRWVLSSRPICSYTFLFSPSCPSILSFGFPLDFSILTSLYILPFTRFALQRFITGSSSSYHLRSQLIICSWLSCDNSLELSSCLFSLHAKYYPQMAKHPPISSDDGVSRMRLTKDEIRNNNTNPKHSGPLSKLSQTDNPPTIQTEIQGSISITCQCDRRVPERKECCRSWSWWVSLRLVTWTAGDTGRSRSRQVGWVGRSCGRCSGC